MEAFVIVPMITLDKVGRGLKNAVYRIQPNGIELRLGKRGVVVLNEIGVGLVRVIPKPR